MDTYPICGDPNHQTNYYYCAYEEMCSITENADARYRKVVDDSGDVCEDVAIACPC